MATPRTNLYGLGIHVVNIYSQVSLTDGGTRVDGIRKGTR